MLVFISPFLLIPIALGVALIVVIYGLAKATIDRIRGPKVIYTPKTDGPELLEAIRSGYSPDLGLELSEIFPDPILGPDIDRILAVRDKIFPRELNRFFYQVRSQDLTPAEFKALALRLYVEMAFIRAYLNERPSSLWPKRAEEVWIYHTPKPLRKLNPDFYRQLLGRFKNNNRSPVAA